VSSSTTIDRLLDDARTSRAATRRARSRLTLAIPGVVVTTWLTYVAISGQWGRVADQWEAALTMVAGGFVAGTTPQGGGAVAFPVFTKVLDVQPEVARTFSLAIQSVGMGAATVAIVAARRRVEWTVVAVVAPAAVLGLLTGLFVLGRSDDPFWPSTLPSSYVKVTFSMIVAAMAFVVHLTHRSQLLLRADRLPTLNPRVVALLVGAGAAGGVASSLVGSGADVCLFIAAAVLLGLSPRVAITTSIVVMALVSVVGLMVLGIADGQLQTAPGATPDLFGLWLAAVPVVAIGAPFGSWVASKASERRLVVFVVALGLLEVLTTVIFLDALHSDVGLVAFTAGAAAVTLLGLRFLARRQRELFALPPLDLDAPLLRGRIDAGPRYRDDLVKGAVR
jgi:uncharacterized membrane protein YfcA